jgi:hypothetical protein
MATVIPKQPKKEREQITIKLDRDVLETLEQYCRYLESSRDYVINQCLVFIFRKDCPLTEWRAGQGLAFCGVSNGTAPDHSVSKAAKPKAKSSAAQGRLPIEPGGQNDSSHR